MSTYRLSSTEGKGIGLLKWILGCLPGALIIALQSLLPAAVLASAGAGHADVGANQTLDLAGVAVVRLLVTYSAEQSAINRLSTTVISGSTTTPGGGVAAAVPLGGQCTGLGVLVRSWQPLSVQDLNSWILTDGDLLSQHQVCGTPGAASSSTRLSSIEIFGSATATAQPLAQINCDAATGACSNARPNLPFTSGSTCPPAISCAHNLALVPFHTPYALPYLDLGPASVDTQGTTFAIELENRQGALPATADIAQADSFLVPGLNSSRDTLTPVPSTNGAEAGMPVVDSSGRLVGLHLSGENGIRTAGEINSFFTTFKLPAGSLNPLRIHWQNGVRDYYQNQNTAARSEFQQVLSESSGQLKGAQEFLQLITMRLRTGPGESQPHQASPTAAGGTLLGLPLLVWLPVAVLLGLVLLLLLVTQTIGKAGARRRRERQRELERFRSEEEEAARRAEEEVRRQRALSQPISPLPPVPPPPAPAPAHVSVESTAANAPTALRCPHCQQIVSRDEVYCPHCRYLLSPSASGLRLRAIPPDVASAPTRPMTAGPATGVEQPTAVMPPVSEQPTLTMMPPPGGTPSAEKTQVAPRQRSRALNLLVGCQTDPGIKRRHKPNEDSLFALQGRRLVNAQLQPYGFFVVADGMGGHANGQDASRLAIQTIVNYVLPRLLGRHEPDNTAYEQLLLEGVQSANQAVHEQNQREHADMGTTMTAALVIGSTAYVANVGDSRTYLYRDGEGLKKVTLDHSVVASLVEAGIIRPEDIYTHPKRNQIYRNLGEKPLVEVDPFREELRPGDKLLLCSDGLWDMTRDPHIEEVLKKTAVPAHLVSDLVQLALDGGGEDNVSVIVVQLVETSKRALKPGWEILAQPDQLVLPKLP
jgi:serine/threonine protein phosphatase PrpC